jgi:tetratricopeptide (TPR) repeat protein
LAAFLAALLFSLSGLATPADPEAAFAEGNRLFEKDEVEGALETYSRAYAGGGSPADGVLAYNAGTCALRLGRLPEALLWYRRAETDAPGDPWLRDNLTLTRRALGDPPEEDPVWKTWLENRRWLAAAGVALSWLALGLLVAVPCSPRGALLALALFACAAFAAGTLLDRFGPHAAVLLAACPGRGGGLPAGSEVWVLPAARGGWRVAGEGPGLLCPAAAVGLVEPPPPRPSSPSLPPA